MTIDLTASYPIPVDSAWEIVDISKMKDYLDCPRKFWWRHVLGWESTAPSNHLIFGEAMHRAMAHLLQTDYSSENILIAWKEKFLPYYREFFPPTTDELMKAKTPAAMLQMLPQYVARWHDDHQRCTTLHVEVGGAVPVATDRVIHLRIDAILQDKQKGFIFGREHKSGSGITRQWETQWMLDLQPTCYTHALRSAFPDHEVKGIELNGIHFKHTKTKGDSFEFIRIPLWKSNENMLVWLMTVNRIYDEIERDFELLAYSSENDSVLTAFHLNPGNCTKYFGCAYHDFCCAWPNPLRKVHECQLGFHINFWDPRKMEIQTKLEEV